jgi:VWFA-related protein
MRRVLMAIVLCVPLAGPIAGQQTQPTFKSGVALVTVDVTVLDKDEKPVPGLLAPDFEIKLDGKAQPVRALTYVQAQGTGASAAATDAAIIEARAQSIEGGVRKGRQTAVNSAPPGESRVFVLLVDDLSFPPTSGRRLFEGARTFVSRLPAADLVGFATTSGAGAVNPTPDRAAITAALAKVVGQFSDPRGIESGHPQENPVGSAKGLDNSPDMPVGIQESLEIDDGNQTMLKNAITRECFNGDTSQTSGQTVESLVVSSNCAQQVQHQAQRTAALTRQATNRQIQGYLSVIKAMASAGGSGIKRLVLLSDGLGLSRDGPTLLGPVVLAAAKSGVQITVLVEEHDSSATDEGRQSLLPGASPSTPQPDPGMTQRRREDDRALIAGVQTLTDMVGGDFRKIIGSPDPFFDRTAVAASAVYRIGVEEPGGAAPGKDFSVSVKVNRPGVTVRVNKRAVASNASNAAPAPLSMEEQLKAAINDGQPLYNVPISTATALRRAPSGSPLDLGVNVAVPSRIKGPLIAMFGLVDDANSVRTGRKTIEAPADGSNYRLSFSIPVTTGTYTLRVAVADSTGAVGSIETSIDAKLETMGPFSASDLLTSWTDAAGKSQFLALEDVPGTVEALDASLELYPLGTPPEPDSVKVRFGLYQRGKPEPIAEKVVEPESGEGFLRASSQFEVGSLAPGTYVLRAVVLSGGKEVGNTQASLRKR